MSDCLPDELWILIFCYLPIKSLIRCAFVCRNWLSLLTSPTFTTSYTSSRPQITSTSTLLLRRYHNQREFYSLHPDDQHRSFLQDSQALHLPVGSQGPYFHLVGSCNGVICLSDDVLRDRESIFLWNPSIRKFLTLPKPLVTSDSHGPYKVALGFGYDKLVDDFKVVRLVYLCGGDKVPPEVELYSLKSCSWRGVNALGPLHKIAKHATQQRGHAAQCFFNGVIHWASLGTSTIVTFTLSNETFGEMEMPADQVFRNVGVMTDLAIGVCSGMIALTKHEGNRSPCVWVMSEYGMVKSWSKYYTIIGSFPGRVLGFRSGGEILLASFVSDSDYNRKRLVSIDAAQGQAKDLGICYGQTFRFALCDYVESLVLLREGQGILQEIDGGGGHA